MPVYAVIIKGSGISVQNEPKPYIGFYTTRYVKSDELDAAMSSALSIVGEEWSTGAYATMNRGSQPKLEVDSVYQLRWLKSLLQRRPGAGCTFYQSEETS